MSQRGSTQSYWAPVCVEIMYFTSYPLPMTHMITGFCCLALSFYITVVPGLVCGMKSNAGGVAADTIEMLTTGFISAT